MDWFFQLSWLYLEICIEKKTPPEGPFHQVPYVIHSEEFRYKRIIKGHIHIHFSVLLNC